jgi:hypothetical protein
MKAPATLDAFYRMCSTKHRCSEVLRRVHWRNGFRCPRCEGRKAHRLRARGLWQWISALQFQRDTGLGSYKTAWALLHKVRATLGRNPSSRSRET